MVNLETASLPRKLFLFLEKTSLIGSFEDSEVFVGEVGGDASAWGAHEIAFLDEERLAHLFDGACFFADGCGDGVDAHRTTLEFLDDSQ